MSGRRAGPRAALAIAAVYLVALAALLLWPNGPTIHRMNLDLYFFFLQRGVPPSVTPEHYAAALNVLIFIPVTAVPMLLVGRGRWWHWALVGAVVSVGVELTQALLPARHTDVIDIMANTLGALIGTGLGALLRRLSRSGQRRRTRPGSPRTRRRLG